MTAKISPTLAAAELSRRQLAKQSRPDLLASTFGQQRAFIEDTSSLKAALCTRRAAKSYSAGIYLFKEALETPGITCLYIALTRESAKKIMWKDVLKTLNRKYKLRCKFNETSLTVTLPNESVIYLVGVDSSEDEKEKLLGQKYKLVIVDESASYTIDLRSLVYSTLKPAVADYRGTICLVGTPGNLTKSLFHDITNGTEPGWSVHKWNTFDNPYMAKQWHDEIAEIEQKRPLFKETPMFKQMYLGQWVIDETALVYKFNPDRNIYAQLPHLTGSWQYLLGVDLGYEDDSAFVAVAFHEYSKILYILETYNAKHMDITSVANKIRSLCTKYDIHKTVIDGANKQAVEEIQKRHNIPLTTADKRGKEDFIEIMNAEFIQGNIKLHDKLACNLTTEYQNLVWTEKGGQLVLPKRENPSCANHLADAALYIWRYTYQYLSGPAPTPKPKWGTPEWHLAETERMQEEAQEYFERQEAATDPYGDYT
jgi:hypothetical protein